MRTLFEDVGLAVVALGVAMFNVPAGVIVAGLLVVLAANLHDGRRAASADADLEPAAAPAGDPYDPGRELAGMWPDR